MQIVHHHNDGDDRIQRIITMTPPPTAAAPPTQPNDHQGIPPRPLAQPVAGGGAGLAPK